MRKEGPADRTGRREQLPVGTREVRQGSRPRGLGAALAVAAVFFAAVAGLVATERLDAAVLVGYAVLSVGLYGLYGADKAAARNHTRRTPENTLQVIALVGGWPGALVAQRRYRHKTRKQPFQAVFWIMVMLNCLAVAWLAAGMPGWPPGFPG